MQFIFGGITLIDFFFVETCHLVLGIFSSLQDGTGNVP